MRTLTDSERVARAYATLDLPPGASAAAALRQYRRLAKRWHPDLYANDPHGQLDALQRMRQINAAFAVIRPLLRQPEVPPPVPPSSWSSAPYVHRDPPPFGSRLRPDEIEAIVESMRGPSMFEHAFVYFGRAWLFVFGIILLVIGADAHKPFDAASGALLVGAVLAHALIPRNARWPRRLWRGWYNR